MGSCTVVWPRVSRRPCTRGPSTTRTDRKSTRLNSSHANISYAVFCLKKKNTTRLHLLDRPLHPITPSNRYSTELLRYNPLPHSVLRLIYVRHPHRYP